LLKIDFIQFTQDMPFGLIPEGVVIQVKGFIGPVFNKITPNRVFIPELPDLR
jgi:hypothetical protein